VVDLFVSWKVERFSRQGRVTDWEQRPRAVELFIEMLQNGGEALIATIDGAPAAVWLFFSVGQTIDSSEGSFDPRYEPYALGTIMHYWMSCEAVSRGASQVYLGWGSDSYKQRFGAVPVTATRLSVFRSQTARAYSSKEAVETARRRLEPRAKATYRRARHAAGQLRRKYRPDVTGAADAAPPS
jgi:CelD/BcsL family acetyltransferase involved in cellulose biosynthesis